MQAGEFVHRAAAYCTLNEGLPEEDVRSLEASLKCNLPPDLAALYQRANGWEERTSPFRLIPAGEIITTNRDILDAYFDIEGTLIDRYGAIGFFFTDDNANYVGFYLTGPLLGRGCFLDHDESDLSPAYRSVGSFLDAFLETLSLRAIWDEEMPRDYPPRHATENAHEKEDDERALKELYALGDPQQETPLAFNIMAITPWEQTESLLAFLENEDPWISERCCEQLGDRRYEPAIPRLVEVAKQDMINAPTAAIISLGKIGGVNARAVECLLELQGALSPDQGNEALIASALRHAGWQADYLEERWMYCAKGSDEWELLQCKGR